VRWGTLRLTPLAPPGQPSCRRRTVPRPGAGRVRLHAAGIFPDSGKTRGPGPAVCMAPSRAAECPNRPADTRDASLGRRVAMVSRRAPARHGDRRAGIIAVWASLPDPGSLSPVTSARTGPSPGCRPSGLRAASAMHPRRRPGRSPIRRLGLVVGAIRGILTDRLAIARPRIGVRPSRSFRQIRLRIARRVTRRESSGQ
jgi:hypothetical protein